MTMTTVRPREHLDPAFVRLAVVLITGILAVVFDTTIVNIALDTLARDLQVGVSTVQWVTTAYLLALGMAVPLSGWLIDRFGGKAVWMGALAVFFVGSVGASLSWDAPEPCRVSRGAGDRWRSDAASADRRCSSGQRVDDRSGESPLSWHCRCCWGPFSVP